MPIHTPALVVKLVEPYSPLITEVLKIRIEVFVWEQKCPMAEEIDQYDGQCYHLVALWQGVVIGTLRLIPFPKKNIVKLGRFVVRKAKRGEGIGKQMMQEAIQIVRQWKYEKIVLDAQVYALPFYENFGFKAIGDPFMDAGIPHKRMELEVMS